MTLGWLWDDFGMTLGLGSCYIVLHSYSYLFIQGGTLIKGGHYRLEKGFDRGHYSRGTMFKGGH